MESFADNGANTGDFERSEIESLLKDVPVWSLPLSTREIDRSHGIRIGGLSTIEPFLAILLDTADSQTVSQAVVTKEGFDKGVCCCS